MFFRVFLWPFPVFFRGLKAKVHPDIHLARILHAGRRMKNGDVITPLKPMRLA